MINVYKEFYVSPFGNDNNDGSEDAPFKTIEKAQAAVREAVAHADGEIIVYLQDGTYTIDSTLRFDEHDGSSFGVRYASAKNATPIISGGIKIKDFSLHDGDKNIYKASVPNNLKFRQLYLDGIKLTRARSNSDYSTSIIGASRFNSNGLIPEWINYGGEDSLIPADYGEIYLNKNEFPLYQNLDKVELHVLTAWVKNVLRVKSVDYNGDIATIRVKEKEENLIFNRMHPNIDGYSHNSNHEFIYYVENAYELIDKDYEWYLDESSSTLYLKVPYGTDLNAKEVIAPRLETLMEIGTASKNKIENLTFEGLSFRYATWNLPSEQGLVDVQAGMYANYCIFATNDVGAKRPSSAIKVYNTKNFTLKDSIIENCGATALDLNYGTLNSVIQSNVIRNISGNGIMVGKFVVDENVDMHVAYNPGDESEICTGDAIFNNIVTNIGTDYEGAVAIAAGYPREILIAHNEISYCPYSGISVGYGWSSAPNAMRDNRIINNDIHHISQILCDAGGIYTLSVQPNSLMSGNYIHDIHTPKWADYGTSTIYMDEQTAGYTVKDNVIENTECGIGRNRNGSNHFVSHKIYVNHKPNAKIRKIKRNAGVVNNPDCTLKQLLKK